MDFLRELLEQPIFTADGPDEELDNQLSARLSDVNHTWPERQEALNEWEAVRARRVQRDRQRAAVIGTTATAASLAWAYKMRKDAQERGRQHRAKAAETRKRNAAKKKRKKK